MNHLFNTKYFVTSLFFLHDSSRHACDYYMWENIIDNHRIRSHNASVSNFDRAQNPSGCFDADTRPGFWNTKFATVPPNSDSLINMDVIAAGRIGMNNDR